MGDRMSESEIVTLVETTADAINELVEIPVYGADPRLTLVFQQVLMALALLGSQAATVQSAK